MKVDEQEVRRIQAQVDEVDRMLYASVQNDLSVILDGWVTADTLCRVADIIGAAKAKAAGAVPVRVATAKLWWIEWTQAGGPVLTATVAAGTQAEAVAALDLGAANKVGKVEEVGTMRGERYTRPQVLHRDRPDP